MRSRAPNEPVRGEELCDTAQDVMELANGACVDHGASDTSNLVSLMLMCYISHALH